MCVAGSGGGTRFARLPPVIEVIPRSGYCFFAHLALTFDKFGCTRHSQGESHEGYTTFFFFYFALCARLLILCVALVRRRFGKIANKFAFSLTLH